MTERMVDLLRIGCVADDFTGASDIASFFQKGGLHTVLCSGIPYDTPIPIETEALVIALKSRTQETEGAVQDCLDGFEYLREHGATTLYFKYCSTFDSRPTGNIGPVIDAVLERYQLRYTVLCPALPVNGRTVEGGILYVDGIPLAESHMKDHPLTPMWASDLRGLMAPQGKYPCYLVSKEMLREEEVLKKQIQLWCERSSHFYLCPDHTEDGDSGYIIARFGDLGFLTGGSGLAQALGHYSKKGYPEGRRTVRKRAASSRLLLAGSCSAATQEQVERFREGKGSSFMVRPSEVGPGYVHSLWDTVERRLDDGDVLVYASGSGGERPEGADSAARLEEVLSALAVLAVDAGIQKLVVAGGETSGAVIRALGYKTFEIGESVAPGVPILYPLENDEIEIVLKSGNFGDKDLLKNALCGVEP